MNRHTRIRTHGGVEGQGAGNGRPLPIRSRHRLKFGALNPLIGQFFSLFGYTNLLNELIIFLIILLNS
jgi:hypothetical protein